MSDFAPLVEAHVSPEVMRRGYFTAKTRDGRESIRPPPRLVVGILPVLPGVFETRHEVMAAAKRANHEAMKISGSGIFVDRHLGNAYPQSVLLDSDPE